MDEIAKLEAEKLELELAELNELEEQAKFEEAANNPALAFSNILQDNLTFGHAPEIHAAVESGTYSDEKYAKLRNQYRKILNEQKIRNPGTDIAANATGFVGSMFNPVTNFKKIGKLGNQALSGGLYSALQNPGDTENFAEEASKRAINAVTGGGFSLALNGAALPIVKKGGEVLYKRGVAPIVHAVDRTLEDSVYPYLEKNGITGSLDKIRDRLQGDMESAGKVVGNTLKAASVKSSPVNHRVLAARLQSLLPTKGQKSGEYEGIDAANNFIQESVGNYQSDAYRAAIPKYRTEMRKWTEDMRNYKSGANMTIFDRAKWLLSNKPPLSARPVRPVKPTNEMSLEALNSVRQSLGTRARKGFSNKQSVQVPVEANFLEKLYPELREQIDGRVKSSMGQSAYEKFEKANETFSLLKPSIDTIKRAVVAADAPQQGFSGATKELMNLIPFTGSGALTRTGQFLRTRDGKRNYNIPRYLLTNGDFYKKDDEE